MRLKLTRSILFAAGMLVFMTGMPSALMAQSSRDMANRLEHLENEIETLNHAIYRGAGSGASVENIGGRAVAGGRGQADAEVRMQQMESEVRSLRGQLEEQNYEIRKLRKQIEALGTGVQRGVSETAGDASSSVSGGRSFEFSSASSDAGSDILSSPVVQGNQDKSVNSLGTLGGRGAQDSAAALYENAFSLLKSANYEQAGVGFEEFLKKNSDHVLSGNAKYWLGETHYVRKQFDVAARIFAEGFQEYPNGAKAADNLLKLGMSLANLGNTKDACVALGQLVKEDYKNAGPVVRRGEQERARLKCGS